MSDAMSVAVPSRLVQTFAIGLVAIGVLFGITQGIASYRLDGYEGRTASSASAPSSTDDELANLKAKADVQPSFDCWKARSASERLICGNAELAALDRGLAQHFDLVRDSLAESDRKAFASEARKAWLARETRCRDVACLTGWYRTRDSQLDAWRARLATVPVHSPSEPVQR